MNELIADLGHEFRRHRQLAERAMAELDDEAFFRRPPPPPPPPSAQQQQQPPPAALPRESLTNPVAVIVKHLAGNLRSRWTDFLTSDGEKLQGEHRRDRDDEFVIGPQDTRARLMGQWAAGWEALEETLASMEASMEASNLVQTTVKIRGENHSVQQALLRGLTHVAYHTGQILYLVRWLKPDAAWLTIAPGKSASHRAAYRSGM